MRKRRSSKPEIDNLENRPKENRDPTNVALQSVPGFGTTSYEGSHSSPINAAKVFKIHPDGPEDPLPHQKAVDMAQPDYTRSNNTFIEGNGAQPFNDSAAQTPTSACWSMPGSSQPSDYGLPDLGTIMFPTTDPLEYPNQPLSILENRNFAQSDDQFDQMLFSAGHTPSTTNSSAESSDAQIYGGMPPYMMQGQHSAMNFQPMGSAMTMERNTFMAVDDGNRDWSMQQMPQSETGITATMDFAPIPGDSWGQWGDQAYNQLTR